MNLSIILLICGIAFLAHNVGFNRAVLALENEIPKTPFFGRNSAWYDSGRGVNIFGIFFIPIYVDTFNHSTTYWP